MALWSGLKQTNGRDKCEHTVEVRHKSRTTAGISGRCVGLVMQKFRIQEATTQEKARLKTHTWSKSYIEPVRPHWLPRSATLAGQQGPSGPYLRWHCKTSIGLTYHSSFSLIVATRIKVPTNCCQNPWFASPPFCSCQQEWGRVVQAPGKHCALHRGLDTSSYTTAT